MRIRISDYFLKVRKISRSEIENKIKSHKLILVESCYFIRFKDSIILHHVSYMYIHT